MWAAAFVALSWWILLIQSGVQSRALEHDSGVEISHGDLPAAVDDLAVWTQDYHDDDNGPNCTEWRPDNRLECWLWQLSIEIPPESFEEEFLKISIRGMVCTEFSIGGIESSYEPPHGLAASVATLRATCHGSYKATGGLSGRVRAGLEEQAAKGTALAVSLRVSPSRTHGVAMPRALNTTSCTTFLKATGIRFSGSTSAKLAQVFAKTIGRYITQTVQKTVCPLLPKQLDPLATKYLGQLDHWMEEYVDDDRTEQFAVSFPDHERGARAAPRALWSPHPSPRMPVTRDATNGTAVDPLEWGTVRWVLGLLNDQLEAHLQKGWIDPPDCPSGCKDMFRGLSGFFHSIVGSELTVNLPSWFHNISLPEDLLPLGAEAFVGVSKISVAGLDRLSSLRLLQPTNTSAGMASSLETGDPGLSVRAPVDLRIKIPSEGVVMGHDLLEPFSVRLNLTGLSTAFGAALRVEHWDTTSLLQVVLAIQRFAEDPTAANIRPALGCLLRTLSTVAVGEGWNTTAAFESFTIARRLNSSSSPLLRESSSSSSLEDGLDDLFNRVSELLLGEYAKLWTLLVGGLVDGPGRRALNDWVRGWLDDHSTDDACPNPVVTNATEPRWANFSRFEILDQLNSFLNEPPTLHTMNRFLECLGLVLEAYAASAASHGLSSSMVELLGVDTDNLGTIESVRLLKPTGDTTVESSIHWGSRTPPTIRVRLGIHTEEVAGTVNLTFYSGLQAGLGNEIRYNLNLLQNLTVAHLLGQAECGFLPMAALRILPDTTGVSVGDTVGLNVSAVLNGKAIAYSTDEMPESKGVPAAINGIADISVDWLRNLANKGLEDWTARSSGMCPGILPDQPGDGDDPAGHHEPTLWYDYPQIWALILLLLLAQGGLVWSETTTSASNNDNNPGSGATELLEPLLLRPTLSDGSVEGPAPLEDDILNGSFEEDLDRLDRALISDIQEEARSDQETFVIPDEDHLANHKSMLDRTAVSPTIRFLLPILVIGTIALLFASNTSVGASVDLSVRLRTTSIQLPGLFRFSLWNTVSELFQARIYPLLFLVVAFSGIWPYAKLGCMLYLWVGSRVEPHTREERLVTLDALSKFSLVDTYVLVVMLVAFRFHLELSEELALDVYVNPEFGFYAFLLATSLSLLLGHGMLYFHRKAELSRLEFLDSESSEGESIFDHAFCVNNDGLRRPLSIFSKGILLVSALAAFFLLNIGFVQKSFSFEFGGLAGMALGDKKRSSYSLLSLGAAIPKSVENPANPAIHCLQMAYYFYAVVMPLACLILILLLLLYPATLRAQRRLLVAVEIANAWSAVEVFVLSIVAALFQISTFASFIIGNRCDIVNRVAETLIGGHIIPEEDAVCFSVKASIDSNSWYLVAGVLLNSFAVSAALRVIHLAIDERTHSLNTTSWVHKLSNLPMAGFCFLGRGLPEEANGTDEIPEAGDSDSDSVADGESPEWRFWF